MPTDCKCQGDIACAPCSQRRAIDEIKALAAKLNRGAIERPQSNKIDKGVHGRFKSKRAVVGGICSQAMSDWKRGQSTPQTFLTLAKCRAMASHARRSEAAAGRGETAMAQSLAHKVKRGMEGGPVTAKDRLARAQSLRAQRATRTPTAAKQQPAPMANASTAAKRKPLHPATATRALRRITGKVDRLPFDRVEKSVAKIVGRTDAAGARDVQKQYLGAAVGRSKKEAIEHITKRLADVRESTARGMAIVNQPVRAKQTSVAEKPSTSLREQAAAHRAKKEPRVREIHERLAKTAKRLGLNVSGQAYESTYGSRYLGVHAPGSTRAKDLEIRMADHFKPHRHESADVNIVVGDSRNAVANNLRLARQKLRQVAGELVPVQAQASLTKRIATPEHRKLIAIARAKQLFGQHREDEVRSRAAIKKSNIKPENRPKHEANIEYRSRKMQRLKQHMARINALDAVSNGRNTPDRLARAKALRAKRAEKPSTSLREQAAAHRAKKGAPIERARALYARAEGYIARHAKEQSRLQNLLSTGRGKEAAGPGEGDMFRRAQARIEHELLRRKHRYRASGLIHKRAAKLPGYQLPT